MVLVFILLFYLFADRETINFEVSDRGVCVDIGAVIVIASDRLEITKEISRL